MSLIVNPGLPAEEAFPLARGTLTIGRTRDNAVFCLHKSLSRKHAQLECDGEIVKITDLQSKNGIFLHGKRVTHGELREGDSFRCGDITFLLDGATTRIPKPKSLPHIDNAVQTLQSPFALDPAANKATQTRPGAGLPRVTVEEEQRYKDKLFLLIRASELCVSELPIDRLLSDLIALAVQVLEVDRIVLLTLDDKTLVMKPRVIKTFVGLDQAPFSERVVNWVVDHASPASFADVSRDHSLPGDATPDRSVRGAMCVPIDPGGGTIGVIYADSLARPDCFSADDLALLRALANLAAVTIESAAFRGEGRQGGGRR